MKTMMVLTICFILVACPILGSDHFILGSKAGDGLLVFPRHISEGPDNNIYVYDLKDGYIKVYSPSGDFQGKIGRKGEGPGDIKRSDGLTFGFTIDNKLFFTQYFGGHRWITILNLNGSFQHILTPKLKEKMYGVEKAVSLPDGGFLIEFSFWGSVEKNNQYYLYREPRCIFHISSNGDIISRIKKATDLTRISYRVNGGDLGIPFTPKFIWCKFKGKTIVFTDGLDSDLKVLNYNGEQVNKIKTSLPGPSTVIKKDLAEWRERLKNLFNKTPGDISWYKTYGKVIEDYTKSVYDKKPYIRDLSLTPGGNILIKGSSNFKKRNDFWLINEDGNIQLKVILNAFMVKISEKFIFLTQIRDDGNEYIYCFKRKGVETQDLLRIEKKFK